MAIATAIPIPIPRRWLLFAGFALTFIFILYQLHQYHTPGTSYRPSPPLYQPPTKVDDGRFHWEDLPVRYPVSNPVHLPSGRPHTLPRVQHKFGAESASDKAVRLQRQQSVKDAFVRCWHSYRERAWLKDELSPISGSSRDSFGGWAATMVDALDTLHIMEMREELKEAIEAVATVDFSTSTDRTVNVFETTIRYLGGFLAAYDLTGERRLLDKAVEIGEMLYVAFDTPNHMPVSRWDWHSAAEGREQIAQEGTIVSELGSLSLEFTRLSQVTGNPKYFDAIQRITELFDAQQAHTKLPGMWPLFVNPRDGVLTEGSDFTLGGMSDSLYEYFPKEYALLGGLSPVYQKLYEDSMTTAMKYNFFRPMTPKNDDILISGDAKAREGLAVALEPKGQHLSCFTGGMLALGGRLFSNQEHVDTGRKLVDGCIWAYDAMPLGIMPEIFHLVPCDSKVSCTWDTNKWTEAVLQKAGLEPDSSADEVIVKKRLPPGFTEIGDTRYILRPEAIESVFILYRITGDKTLQDSAWRMFSSIQRLTETEFANAALLDVTITDGLPPKDDRMESFWLAETLKYFYLIFSEPDLISLDEFVLNTEAHPFRRPS